MMRLYDKNSWKHFFGMASILILLSPLVFQNKLWNFILGYFAVSVMLGVILGFLVEMAQKIINHIGFLTKIFGKHKVSRDDFWATVKGAIFGYIISVVIRLLSEVL